jgi:phage pi2 protein 07
VAEKDYAAIAKSKIQRPASINRLPKFHIYARNKKGKTTFGLTGGVDKTLVLDPEHGTDMMKTKNPHVWHIEKWEDIDEAYNFIRLGDHEYEWIVVDGLTRLSQMSLKYTMRLQEERSIDRIPGQVQQRDYGKAGEVMKTMLTNFQNLQYGVIFTSQERANEAADSEEDEDIESESMEYVPDLPKGVRGYVNSIVDVIGRLYVVKIEDEKTQTTKAQRRMWIGESLKYDTGYRSDYVLPDMVKLPTIPKLLSLMESGKVPAPRKNKVTK